MHARLINIVLKESPLGLSIQKSDNTESFGFWKINMLFRESLVVNTNSLFILVLCVVLILEKVLLFVAT